MPLIWEVLKSEMQDRGFWQEGAPPTLRTKVPGGWFVWTERGPGAGGAFFYPDPEHLWDGSSLP